MNNPEIDACTENPQNASHRPESTWINPRSTDPLLAIQEIESSLTPDERAGGAIPPKWLLQERMQVYNIPAVSIAAVNDFQIEWAKAYGILRKGSSDIATTATAFQAGSISKPAAAIGALCLVQQGVISLKENVNTRLRDWKLLSGTGELATVTLEQLLSHTSGIGAYGLRGYPPSSEIPSLLELLNGTPPSRSPAVRVIRPPGTEYLYSGQGYAVIQRLLDEAGGKPFIELMNELVFRPLAMENSAFHRSADAPPIRSVAAGHDKSGKCLPGNWNVYPVMTVSGLWSTSMDLAKLMTALQRIYRGQSGSVLEPEIVRDMLRARIGKYGLGFPIIGEGDGLQVQHGGQTGGYRCFIVCHLNTGQGAAIMTNGNNGFDLIFEILRSIAKFYKWPPSRPIGNVGQR